MKDKQLSYIITTRNKLPFLQQVMMCLLENVQADEEIIVTDGASTDGTKEYLEELFKAGKIHQFISEPDKGEAHGWNKGLLMAHGELIKLITDDDAFYYPGIRACREFMLEHTEIDVLGTNGAAADSLKTDGFFPFGPYYNSYYEKWRDDSKPFTFCGLGLMIRKSSLPLIGLFYTGIVRVDYEFGLRITSGKINLAWYTGNCYVRIANPKSNSITQSNKMLSDQIKCDYFYLGILPKSQRNRFLDLIISKICFLICFFKNHLNSPKKCTEQDFIAKQKDFSDKEVGRIYEICTNWLNQINEKEQGTFLYGHGK